MFLTKTLFVAATLTAGLLTSPPAAAKPGRVLKPTPSATSPKPHQMARQLVFDEMPGALAVVRTLSAGKDGAAEPCVYRTSCVRRGWSGALLPPHTWVRVREDRATSDRHG